MSQFEKFGLVGFFSLFTWGFSPPSEVMIRFRQSHEDYGRLGVGLMSFWNRQLSEIPVTWNINFSLVGFNWMTPNLYIENDSLTNNIHSNFGCFRFQGHLIVTFLLIPFQWGKSNSRALSFSRELCLGMVDTLWLWIQGGPPDPVVNGDMGPL